MNSPEPRSASVSKTTRHFSSQRSLITPVWRVGFAILALQAAHYAADSASTAPATITKEGDLVILTLKPEAEQSLRLKTVAVEKRIFPATRLFSGEVVIPLSAVGKNNAPVLGGTLDEVLRLADLQVAADGRILQAQVQIDAAKIAVERAQKMLSAEAGSVRGVDEAQTALQLAEAAMTTAKAQRDLLGGTVGQSTRKWVRVAIYSAEATQLDAQAASSIGKPVTGPPTANALTNTIDWYYQLPAETKLRAGERIAVEIPTLEGKEERLIIPFNAVLHDIHGGQWVYAKTADHTYTRKRIQVARLAGTDAVLTTGPAVGTQIVTDGSAELFGAEFMTGK